MSFLQKNMKYVVLISALVITSGMVIAAVVFNPNDGVKVKLLNNAGVMIEKDGTRIYIDPYDLPSSYSDYPADAVLITHEHGDHYDPSSLDLIETATTSFYFPKIMSEEAILYDATPVVPEDSFTVNNFNVTCFYMYTMPGSLTSSHPRENNYTSYIVEIDGFTIFHAGDSWNIEEYSQLTDKIDLVLLPLGPGCQTMAGIDVVAVIETINPEYFIPIHFTDEGKEDFIDFFKSDVEDCGCKFIDLDYFSSKTFG